MISLYFHWARMKSRNSANNYKNLTAHNNTMTTTEHLQKIKAECERLLAIAEKRTQGKWRVDYSVSFNHIVTQAESEKPLNQRKAIATTHKMYSEKMALADVVYIAACAGAAEAGWRSTIAAVNDLLRYDLKIMQDDPFMKSILAAWPTELLS
jgi:hypothetical protein